MDILLAILDRFDHNTRAHYEDPSVQQGDLDGILGFLRERFHDFKAKPAFAAVIFAEEHFRNHRLLTRRIMGIMEQHRKLFTTLIRRAQKAGSIRTDVPAGNVFVTVFGAFRLLVKRWHLNGMTFDITREGNKLIKSLRILIAA